MRILVKYQKSLNKPVKVVPQWLVSDEDDPKRPVMQFLLPIGVHGSRTMVLKHSVAPYCLKEFGVTELHQLGRYVWGSDPMMKKGAKMLKTNSVEVPQTTVVVPSPYPGTGAVNSAQVDIQTLANAAANQPKPTQKAKAK